MVDTKISSRAGRIKALLEVFQPHVLEVENLSAAHHGHAGDDGSGETHYRIVIGAKAFAQQTRVQSHRAVLGCLAPEFSSGLHSVKLSFIEN